MEHLSQSEIDLFREVATVMKKYEGKTREFGMCLVHKHFSVNQDEIMHETNDPVTRTLTVKPVKIAEMPAGSHPTQWKVIQGGKAEAVQWCCDDIKAVQWCCSDQDIQVTQWCCNDVYVAA